MRSPVLLFIRWDTRKMKRLGINTVFNSSPVPIHSHYVWKKAKTYKIVFHKTETIRVSDNENKYITSELLG